MGDYATHLKMQAARVAALRTELEAVLPVGEPVTLEFGCGHGHWLTAFAEAHPDRVCVGLDLVTYRIRKATAKKEKRGLERLHFLKGEATELLMAWPEDRPLREVFMLFPDPWPKARHHKHRMIQLPFLETVARYLQPGARFFFRTDHADYFDWTTEHFEESPYWALAPSVDWPWETPTFFQNLMESWQSLCAERTEVIPPVSLPEPENEGAFNRESDEDQRT